MFQRHTKLSWLGGDFNPLEIVPCALTILTIPASRLPTISLRCPVDLAIFNNQFYSNSCFSRTSNLWNNVPIYWFPGEYKLQSIKCNVNGYLQSSGTLFTLVFSLILSIFNNLNLSVTRVFEFLIVLLGLKLLKHSYESLRFRHSKVSSDSEKKTRSSYYKQKCVR